MYCDKTEHGPGLFNRSETGPVSFSVGDVLDFTLALNQVV